MPRQASNPRRRAAFPKAGPLGGVYRASTPAGADGGRFRRRHGGTETTMLKLTQRGKTWHITGTLRGKRYRESTGTDSRPHAEALLSKRQSEILDRDVWGEKRTSLFAEAVVLYVEGGGEARFLKPLLDRWGSR